MVYMVFWHGEVRGLGEGRLEQAQGERWLEQAHMLLGLACHAGVSVTSSGLHEILTRTARYLCEQSEVIRDEEKEIMITKEKRAGGGLWVSSRLQEKKPIAHQPLNLS